MTTKTDELKPCPFCGCANIHITPDEVDSGGQWVGPVHVVCGGDCVAGQSGDDRESAIAAWNRRAALQSQDREDAERYRWLRNDCLDGCFAEIAPVVFNTDDCFKHDDEALMGEALDKAIDHARRIEGES